MRTARRAATSRPSTEFVTRIAAGCSAAVAATIASNCGLTSSVPT